MLVQAGRDKPPDLMKNNRAGQQDTGNKRELQIKKKPSW
jgi:hypothetical protein